MQKQHKGLTIKNIKKNHYVYKNFVLNEYLYNSLYFTKLLNNAMYVGKKDVVIKIFYNVLIRLKFVLMKNPEILFYHFHLNLIPLFKIKKIKKAKRLYSVPVLISSLTLQDSLTYKLLISAFRKNNQFSFFLNMLREFYSFYFDFYNSYSIKMLNDTISIGVQNRVYGHFRY